MPSTGAGSALGRALVPGVDVPAETNRNERRASPTTARRQLRVVVRCIRDIEFAFDRRTGTGAQRPCY
jgi:hypothetical protein